MNKTRYSEENIKVLILQVSTAMSPAQQVAMARTVRRSVTVGILASVIMCGENVSVDPGPGG